MPSAVGTPSSMTIVPSTDQGLSATACRMGRVAGFSSPQKDRLNGVKKIEPSIENAAIVTESAPELTPKTWYGMPAYAKDGKVVFFFRNAGKFKERYAMFGFNDSAKLDEGSMWPIAYALTELTAADEAKIRKLVKRAVS